MISCQFLKFFKNTFFIQHLRWLLLAILKPLDSQRQLCKWISKLATMYFISTFCWHFCAYFWQAQVFLLHLDGPVVEEIWRFWFLTWPYNWSVTWLFGRGSIILIQHPTKFWGPWTLWMWRQNVLTWDVNTWWCVTWFCRWGPLILNHHPVKLGVHRPCESGNRTFSICHVTTISKCHLALWFGPRILSH